MIHLPSRLGFLSGIQRTQFVIRKGIGRAARSAIVHATTNMASVKFIGAKRCFVCEIPSWKHPGPRVTLCASLPQGPAFLFVGSRTPGRRRNEQRRTQQFPSFRADIGANLLDDMYQGEYHEKQYHPPDMDAVLGRAWAAGMDRMMVTAGSLAEARKAIDFCSRDPARLFTTVGCHPTRFVRVHSEVGPVCRSCDRARGRRASEFDAHEGGPEAYLEGLMALAKEGAAYGAVVAIGECGLDYDRLHFSDAETQQRNFRRQFALQVPKLPPTEPAAPCPLPNPHAPCCCSGRRVSPCSSTCVPRPRTLSVSLWRSARGCRGWSTRSRGRPRSCGRCSGSTRTSASASTAAR